MSCDSLYLFIVFKSLFEFLTVIDLALMSCSYLKAIQFSNCLMMETMLTTPIASDALAFQILIFISSEPDNT